MEDKPLVNRVANSGLVTINLEDFFPKEKVVIFDLKDYLFMELILKEKDFRAALKEHDQILFEYCDETGKVTDEANPNGSTNNIAGICNANRNVFGMMPHPERASEKVLGNDDGRIMFESLIGLMVDA